MTVEAPDKLLVECQQISPETYPEYIFEDGIVVNPYKGIKLLLLPVELLHELPIARCWDDIDRVCRENDAIRAEINDIVGAEWAKMRSAEKKQYLRNWIFMNPEKAGRVIESYKASTVAQYDPLSFRKHTGGNTVAICFNDCCSFLRAQRLTAEWGSLLHDVWDLCAVDDMKYQGAVWLDNYLGDQDMPQGSFFLGWIPGWRP